MSGRTVILDGHSLAHRAYHALPPTLTDPSGKPVNAVLGFCNMLVKVLEQEGTERVVCAFDSPGPVFRHSDFADYKATRKPMDQELREQIPVIKQACSAFGVEVAELAGFEADDLLGTMARRLESKGREALIVTSDRDSYQLASDKVKLMMTRKGLSEFEMMGPEEVKAACGVPPELVPDLKGLIGDASDNIPGVMGIGEKTAVKLITEFGSLEAMLERVGEMRQDRTAGLLISGRDMALLSKKLATIDVNVPIDFDPEAVPVEPDEGRLKDFLASKGFRSLLSKMERKAPKRQKPQTELFGAMPPEASMRPLERQSGSFNVHHVADLEALGAFEEVARRNGRFSIDYVSDGRGWEAAPDRLVLGTDAAAYELAVYTEGPLIGPAGFNLKDVLQRLSGLLYDSGVLKSGWDIKSTLTMLRRYGASVNGIGFDPMLAGFLINPLGRTDSPSDMLFKYFGMAPSQLEPYGANGPKLAVAALMGSLERAMGDELEELGMTSLFRGVEMPLVGVLSDMECAGVRVDIDMLRRISEEMGGKLKRLEADIYSLAGGDFNIGSPRQLGAVLFEKLGLPAAKKTKTGYSTDADVLEGLLPLNPIVGKILEYRGTSKLKSTYVDVLPELAARQGGRIHTSFNQTGAVTGRLSSSDPNMQNIPIKSDEGLEIRGAFGASEGKLIVSADYSQIELRILAHLSKDPLLVESFRLGQDVHTRTASEVFGVPLGSVDRRMRTAAKTVNFGLIYGQSEFGLSRTLGIGQSEAKDFIDRYFRKYVMVREYFNSAIELARKQGFISTIMGRRRQVPELYSSNFNTRKFGERIVMNAPIQGSAADIIKVAMIRLRELLLRGEEEALLILQVHDELVLEVASGSAEAVADSVRRTMEEAVALEVPLVAEAGIGPNWKEAR